MAAVAARALSVVSNRGLWATAVEARAEEVVSNRALWAIAVKARAEEVVEGARNVGQLFPWIERLDPGAQQRGGQVGICGDGFGDTQAEEGGVMKLAGELMGVVTWSSRSPGLWPCNSGVRSTPAVVVTVPPDAVSGLVVAEESAG